MSRNKQTISDLVAASTWLEKAYRGAVDDGEAEAAGHAKAAQLSINAALGALSKKTQVAS